MHFSGPRPWRLGMYWPSIIIFSLLIVARPRWVIRRTSTGMLFFVGSIGVLAASVLWWRVWILLSPFIDHLIISAMMMAILMVASVVYCRVFWSVIWLLCIKALLSLVAIITLLFLEVGRWMSFVKVGALARWILLRRLMLHLWIYGVRWPDIWASTSASAATSSAFWSRIAHVFRQVLCSKESRFAWPKLFIKSSKLRCEALHHSSLDSETIGERQFLVWVDMW